MSKKSARRRNNYQKAHLKINDQNDSFISQKKLNQKMSSKEIKISFFSIAIFCVGVTWEGNM